MQTESIPDALADALGRVLAKERDAWRKERELAQAESRQTIAELGRKVAEFELTLHQLQLADHERVDERVALLKDGRDGVDGKDGLNGKDGEPGANGRDGVEGLAGKDGRDGVDGKDGLNGKDGESGINGKDGADGLAGKDGRDGVDGKDGLNGKDGDPGINGKDGADGLAGKDGLNGKDGERGLEGPAGKFTAPKEWNRGVHYEGQLVTHEGATYCAKRDTAEQPPHDDWSLVAAKGKDAPVGEVCGLYDEGKVYRKFDIVAFNGCEWRATKDNPGALPGEGWALSAKQGKRGDKGERGDRGEAGKEGKQGIPGVSIVERKIVGFMLIDAMSDGSIVECDIRPAFEQYHGEAR